MAEVKWIKITTNIFDDEKIKLIDAMPERDTIFYIWIRLLVQAGKTNAGGYIFLTERIPYTEEMLSTLFSRQTNSVRFALKTLQDFNMIMIRENNLIKISNWEKHQNVDKLESIRDYNRLAKQKERARKKLAAGGNKENINTVSLTDIENVNDSHAIEVEEEVDKEVDKEITTAATEKYLDFFNNNFHKITPFEIDILKGYEIDGIEPRAITLALQEAVASGNRNIGYVKKILNRWLQNNIKTLEAVRFDKAEFERKKKTGKNEISKNQSEDVFNKFEQRTYDFDSLEKKLLGWDKI